MSAEIAGVLMIEITNRKIISTDAQRKMTFTDDIGIFEMHELQ